MSKDVNLNPDRQFYPKMCIWTGVLKIFCHHIVFDIMMCAYQDRHWTAYQIISTAYEKYACEVKWRSKMQLVWTENGCWLDNTVLQICSKRCIHTKFAVDMMMSSNRNISALLAFLCGEFTSHRWIPLTKASDAALWMCCLICAWTNGWIKNRNAGDLRRHRAHYDVIVIHYSI